MGHRPKRLDGSYGVMIAGPGVPTGGATGQFLEKNGPNDYNTIWSTISITDVQGLIEALDAKVDDAELATIPTAIWGNITGVLANQLDLQAALNGKANSVHSHVIADTTGLQAALDSKVDDSELGAYATDAELAAGLANYIPLTQKGAASGVAPLNGSILIDAVYLPSYVDDVVEYANLAAFPATGESGKIYVALDSGKTYRWTGSAYVEISSSAPAAWGTITGTLSNQTDLQAALDAKADDSDLAAYATDAELAAGLATKADLVHTHVPADILTVPTGTVFYRKTAGTGAAETQTLATLKTDLAITETDLNSTFGHSIFARIGASAGTLSEVQLAPSQFIGRGASGNISALTLNTTLSFTALALGVVKVPNAVTFAAAGGAAAGSTFDGSAALTISPVTIGAAAAVHTHVIADVTGLTAALDGKADDGDLAAYLPLTGGTISGGLNIGGAGGGATYQFRILESGSVGYLQYGAVTSAPNTGQLQVTGYGGVALHSLTVDTFYGIALKGTVNITGTAVDGTAIINLTPFTAYPYSAINLNGIGGAISAGMSILAGGTNGYFSADNFTFRSAASVVYATITATGLAVTGNVTVTNEDYGGSWNGSNQVPTKNAVYDKIEAVTAGGGGVTTFNTRSGAVTLTSADVTGALTYTPASITDLANYLPLTGGTLSGNLTARGINSFGPQTVIADGYTYFDHKNSFNTINFRSWASGSAVTQATLLVQTHFRFQAENGYTFNNLANTINYATINATGLAVTGTITATGAISGSNLSGTNTGDQTTVTGNAGTATALATSRNFSISGSGISAAAVAFNGTANVVLASSVDAGHITLARMANLAANSIIGNNTGSGAVPLALTGANVTAMLSVAGSSVQGVVLPPGGTTTFLRADGTWAAPAGGSTPTGTGFRHVTSGVEDAAAKLVDTADINDAQVTYAKMQNATGFSVPCRPVTGTGVQSEVALTAGTLLGRGTTGNVAAIAIGSTLTFGGAATLAVASVPQTLLFNNSGTGDATGNQYNGGTARTLSYNSIGAQPDAARVGTSTSAATLVPVATNDMTTRTTQTVTLAVSAPTGTPVNGFGHVVRIKATAAIAVSWNATYRAIGITLPLAIANGKTIYVGMIYNSADSVWDCVSLAVQA